MNKLLTGLLYLTVLISCDHSEVNEKPLRWLGDISYDEKLDNKDFTLCHGEEKVFQYFNLGDNIEFKGGKPAIIKTFKEAYEASAVPKESGLIRIRFLVNCKGETDRFRMLEGDLKYKEKKFDKRISSQIMEITKSLEGWGQKFQEESPVDYYQYLVFRIVEGKIKKILP